MTPNSATFGYVICSEHRSGSTYLCQVLKSTGRLGNPDEYFRDSVFSKRLDQRPELIETVLETATTPNGVYGLKVFSQQLDATREARWLGRLPNVHFIHLERRDLLGQAISFVRALQTNQYFSTEFAVSEPVYDRRAIHRQIRRIALAQARWRRYFARNGLDPLWITYEDLVAAPAAAAKAVADHLGLKEPTIIDPSLVGVTVQRDSTSEEWKSRFLLESADLNRLDHHFGDPRVRLRRLARDVGLLWAAAKRRD